MTKATRRPLLLCIPLLVAAGASACAGKGGAAAGVTAGTSGSSASGSSSSNTCSLGCDDGFSCTLDVCQAGVCVHSIGPNVGATACPTGQYCTAEKGCLKSPACAKSADCAAAWTGDACKANVRCDAASAVCLFDLLDKDDDGHSPPVCGGDDCDDADFRRYPGAPEICDGKDNDCNGQIDDTSVDTCGIGWTCATGSCVSVTTSGSTGANGATGATGTSAASVSTSSGSSSGATSSGGTVTTATTGGSSSTSGGSGGNPGTGSTGSGGATGSSTAGGGTKLAWDATGWIDKTTNAFAIQGPLYVTADGLAATGQPPGDCQSSGFLTSQCSGISLVFPRAGVACVTGIAAAVVNCPGNMGQCTTPGSPAYSAMWGAALDLGFDATNLGALRPYNAASHGIVGISFDVDSVPAGGIRVAFPAQGQGLSWRYVTILGAGHQEVRFADTAVGYDPVTYPGPTDAVQLLSAKWWIATTTTASQPFSFCISNLQVLDN